MPELDFDALAAKASPAAVAMMLQALTSLRADLKMLGIWRFYDETRCVGLGGACDELDEALRMAGLPDEGDV